MSEQEEREFTFFMEIRDLNAPNHWRSAPKNYSFSGHKTVLILPGSATNSAEAANGMCKVVERALSEKDRKDVDICCLYYPQKTKGRTGSVERALTLLDKYIMPLVSKEGKKGEQVKISADKAAKNLRNLTIFTHCYGSYMVEAIDIKLASDLQNLGYSKQERENIQRQLFVIHHNDISDLLGAVKMKSTNLYRITQADERRNLCRYKSDSFQYYAQTEQLGEDEALYVKVGKNERALLIKQITEEGEDEHNGAYWHDDKKSEGGETERALFEAIFSEAVRSYYPLDNIEELVRQLTRRQPLLKEEFTDPMTYGKEFGDEYVQYHQNIVRQVKTLRDKQNADELKEKEVKTLSPEVLLYMDENDKMLLDYAVENNNLPQAKILWNAVRKQLPKNEILTEADFVELGRNYGEAYNRNHYYLQSMLNEGRPEMFAALAKGADCLTQLDYSNTDDKTLLGAAKVYAGLPANTGQLDKLKYYKLLAYMYARVEEMEQSAETSEVLKQLESKVFTKANAKDDAVKYKVKSYSSRYGAEGLFKKCEQQWSEKPLVQHSEELHK